MTKHMRVGCLIVGLLAVCQPLIAGVNFTIGTDGFYQDQGDHDEYHRHAQAAHENYIEAKRKYERRPTEHHLRELQEAEREMRRYHEYR